jgi:protoporphyrinogen/coproporphyrinogen III oxidase
MPSHISVIGGGISGLSTAFHLSRRFPRSFISLFEKDNKFGGWIRSERVNGVLLESGPRTLRPSSTKPILELVSLFLLLPQPTDCDRRHRLIFLGYNLL